MAAPDVNTITNDVTIAIENWLEDMPTSMSTDTQHLLMAAITSLVFEKTTEAYNHGKHEAAVEFEQKLNFGNNAIISLRVARGLLLLKQERPEVLNMTKNHFWMIDREIGDAIKILEEMTKDLIPF